MSRPLKRRRISAPRPITKSLLFFYDQISGAQSEKTLTLATFPCTLTGLRWDLSTPLSSTDTTTFHYMNWAIVIVKQGNDANDLLTAEQTEPAILYEPEQNVLATGMMTPGLAGSSNTGGTFRGSTKTMRKLQQGDRIVIIFRLGGGTDLNELQFGGTIQFFCKS